MGTVAIPSSNVNLRANIRAASASALQRTGTSNVSLRGQIRDELSPGDSSAPHNVSTIDNITYRVMVLGMDTSAGGGGTVSVTSPTSPSHYRYDGSSTYYSDNSLTYSEANSGGKIYLRGCSYSTYTVVSVSATADYGYTFAGWLWYNSSGTYQSLASTSTSYSLSSTMFTGAQYYELRADWNQDETS